MLMAPTLVPVLIVGAGAEAADVAAGLDGVAALPVWAKAETVKVTATARRIRRNLLVIGSVELLGTCSSEHASGNEFQLSFSDCCSDRLFSQRWAAMNESPLR
jgi:hypothetical protein